MRKATWTNKRAYGSKKFTGHYIRAGVKRLFVLFANSSAEPVDWYESSKDAVLDGWEKTL